MSTTTIRALALHQPAPLAHDDECQQRSSHPLLGAAIKALYEATDAIHRLGRAHGCRIARCSLCSDVRQSLTLLDTLLCSLEGEFSFGGSEQLSRRRDKSRACQADTRRRSSRPWRPGCGTNHPLHPLTVLILVDAGKALDALHRSRECGEYVTDQAAAAAFLIPLLVGQLEQTLIPTPEYLRMRWPMRGRARLLRLLEEAERL